jgi:hypothetical protein
MIRGILLATLVLLAANKGKAPSRAIPLPQPRPPLATAGEVRSSEAGGSLLSGPSKCFADLMSARAVADRQDPIVGPGLCGASDLVRLKTIRLVNGRLVALHPPAQVRCPIAEVLTRWVQEDVAPAVEMIGSQLAGLGIATSYDCRTRNGVVDAKLSEHATGDAIDLYELTLSNGKNLVLTATSVDKALRGQLERSACRRFTTVLGPGSDAYHESHIHLDQLQRRGGYRICQWDVR